MMQRLLILVLLVLLAVGAPARAQAPAPFDANLQRLAEEFLERCTICAMSAARMKDRSGATK